MHPTGTCTTNYSLLPLLAFLLFAILVGCNPKSEQAQQPKYVPYEDLAIARSWPDPYPNYKAQDEALRAIKHQIVSQLRNTGSWETQGPGNIGARINTVAIHPTDDNTIVVGYSDGGIWITKNGGVDWHPIFDKETNLSVSSLAFDPKDGNTLYAGTGDVNIGAFVRAGNGLFKSTDLGATWKYIGLANTRIISKVVVHPSNSKLIFAGAMGVPFVKNNDRGIYKSTDGGSTWTQSLFINDSTGISDLVVDPTNQNIAYAISWNRIRNNTQSTLAGPDSKVWKTTNGGTTWQILSNGLPTGNFSRLGLAMAPSNPSTLYVQYCSTASEFHSIYMSTDAGASWALHTSYNTKGLGGSPLGGFGWYFGKIRVHPENEKIVYLLGVLSYVYQPESDFWDYAEGTDVHVDKHDLVFRNRKAFLATDGGLYKADLNRTNWTKIENIPTTQAYRTAYDPHRQDTYWAGAQDNGTSFGTSTAINDWSRAFGGDGFQMAFHPTNRSILYVASQNGGVVVSTNSGTNWSNATNGVSGSRNWDMPYMLSPHNPDVLFMGSDRLYKSTTGTNPSFNPISPVLTSGGRSSIWRSITGIDQSTLNSNSIGVCTTNGLVWITKNGGTTWSDVSSGLPARYLSAIKASRQNTSTWFVSHTGYRDNDNTPHLFRSTDDGKTWVSISSNLPQVAIYDIYVYPYHDDKVLFVATDGGVYFTVDSGAKWVRMGGNMPIIPVFDLDCHLVKNQIIAATFARGILTFDLRQLGIDRITSTFNSVAQSTSIYPTRSADVVNIDSDQVITDVRLYDMSGRSHIVNYTDGAISISNVSIGTYILIVNGRAFKVQRI